MDTQRWRQSTGLTRCACGVVYRYVLGLAEALVEGLVFHLLELFPQLLLYVIVK